VHICRNKNNSRKMKTILTLTLLLITLQAAPQCPQVRYEYIELQTESYLFRSTVTAQLNGKTITDTLGAKIRFESPIAALNYVAAQGWELCEFGKNAIWILRREVW